MRPEVLEAALNDVSMLPFGLMILCIYVYIVVKFALWFCFNFISFGDFHFPMTNSVISNSYYYCTHCVY